MIILHKGMAGIGSDVYDRRWGLVDIFANHHCLSKKDFMLHLVLHSTASLMHILPFINKNLLSSINFDKQFISVGLGGGREEC